MVRTMHCISEIGHRWYGSIHIALTLRLKYCYLIFVVHDENLRKAYPRLAAELLQQPSGRAVRLQPGTPCDNYRGYCDVFFVCRSVEVEGPLARLHKLLFSPQMLSKVKTWITLCFELTLYRHDEKPGATKKTPRAKCYQINECM
ncbi:hypothetical protein ACTXT7_014180 [Hymenolepis weldensis]